MESILSVPVFIPYVNRPDLLQSAVNSMPECTAIVARIINNSGAPIPVKNVPTYNPPVPLTFTQTQNWMLAIAKQNRLPFYFFMHSDAEAAPETVGKLYEMAAVEFQRGKWGAIFTSYDALAAFNTEAFDAIGGWDTMFSWYCADNDSYRRLRLAGYPTLESNLPVKHEPSQTLKSDPEIKRKVDVEIPIREYYYREKWGGPPGQERYATPFNLPAKP